jgi:hypothetical protein
MEGTTSTDQAQITAVESKEWTPKSWYNIFYSKARVRLCTLGQTQVATNLDRICPSHQHPKPSCLSAAISEVFSIGQSGGQCKVDNCHYSSRKLHFQPFSWCLRVTIQEQALTPGWTKDDDTMPLIL